jgi:hypothetical protein
MTTRLAGWIVGARAVALVLTMIAPGAVLVLAMPVAVVGSILTRRRPTGHEDRDVAERLIAAATTLTGERTSPDGEQVDWGAALRAELATITVPRERRRFALGGAVALLGKPHRMDDTGLELADGIEAKQVILTQLAPAFEVIRHHDPASQYPGFHAMAVAALTGHGHPEVQALLPATVSPDWVALVGLHAWAEDDIANVAHWGIRAFSPDDLRATTQPLGDWLAGTGCSRVAIHFDVDTSTATSSCSGSSS